jgi:hypothetical protein
MDRLKQGNATHIPRICPLHVYDFDLRWATGEVHIFCRRMLTGESWEYMLMKKIKRLLLGLEVMLALGLGLFIKVKVTQEQAMKA